MINVKIVKQENKKKEMTKYIMSMTLGMGIVLYLIWSGIFMVDINKKISNIDYYLNEWEDITK